MTSLKLVWKYISRFHGLVCICLLYLLDRPVVANDIVKEAIKYLSNSGLEDVVEVGMVPEEGPVHCHHHLPAESIFGSF